LQAAILASSAAHIAPVFVRQGRSGGKLPERVLANLRIDELEKFFDQKRKNTETLTTLLAELSHRRTSRARVLKNRVMQALAVAGSSDKSA
jgi:hypothetical protein